MICWHLIVMLDYSKSIDGEKEEAEVEDYFDYNDAYKPLVAGGRVVDQRVWKIHDEMYDENDHLVDWNNDVNTYWMYRLKLVCSMMVKLVYHA